MGERLTSLEWLRAQTTTVWVTSKLLARTLIPSLREKPLGDTLAAPDRLEQGLILVLPGIAHESFLTHDIARGLEQAQLPDAIEPFDWTPSRVPVVGNLFTAKQNRRQARQVAQRIRRYQRDYPDRPVHLVGYSGGAAEAVMILEELDPAEPVSAAILMGTALSPGYNLAPAMRRTRYGIYSLYNPRERFMLGLGLVVFGTMDRRHTAGAGKDGFVPPRGLSAEDAHLYRTRFRQVRWNRRMLADGHPGGHIGWTDRRFVARWPGQIIAQHHRGKHAEF
jgi:hypothetical protein